MTDDLLPGQLRPGTDLAALAAAIDELSARVEQLTSERSDDSVQAITAKQRQVAFMVMPFGPEDLQIVYTEFVKPALEERCQVECIRGDDIFGSNVIMEDVSSSIEQADLLVADLTGRNPNVFYEVGIGHALGKPVLLLAQSLDDIPFDLRHRRVLLYDYSPKGCKRLEIDLVEHVLGML